MNGEYKRQRRRALFERQNGRCHWCKGAMILPDVYPAELKNPDPKLCTLDHLRDRLDVSRWDKWVPGDEHRTVAACYLCNKKRGEKKLREARASGDLVSVLRRRNLARANRASGA